jgi:hypothetical protein
MAIEERVAVMAESEEEQMRREVNFFIIKQLNGKGTVLPYALGSTTHFPGNRKF